MRGFKIKEFKNKLNCMDKKECDLCGLKVNGEDIYDDNSWTDLKSKVLETIISIKEGEIDAADDCGGEIEEKAFDICPKCFKEKLIPWLEKQGADVRISKICF